MNLTVPIIAAIWCKLSPAELTSKITPHVCKQKLLLIVKFVGDKTMEVMNVVEKRDFIHSHLHRADESIIDEFYQKLRKSNVLKEKLESRAGKAEDDIRSGRVFSRTEIEQRTAARERK